jgi:hypothetical protein
MPAAFDRAYHAGGMVRTKKLPHGKYVHMVKDPKTGKWIMGEVKTKKGGR